MAQRPDNRSGRGGGGGQARGGGGQGRGGGGQGRGGGGGQGRGGGQRGGGYGCSGQHNEDIYYDDGHPQRPDSRDDRHGGNPGRGCGRRGDGGQRGRGGSQRGRGGGQMGGDGYRDDRGQRGGDGYRDDRGQRGGDGYRDDRGQRGGDGYRDDRGQRGGDGYRDDRGQRGGDGYRDDRGQRGGDGYRDDRGQRGGDGYRDDHGQRGGDGYRDDRGQRDGDGYRDARGQRGGDGYRDDRGQRGGDGYRDDRGQRGGDGYRDDRGQRGGDGYRDDRGQRGGDGYRDDRGQRGGDGYRDDRGQRGGDGYRDDHGQRGGDGYRDDRGQRGGDGYRDDRGQWGGDGYRDDRGQRGGGSRRGGSRGGQNSQYAGNQQAFPNPQNFQPRPYVNQQMPFTNRPPPRYSPPYPPPFLNQQQPPFRNPPQLNKQGHHGTESIPPLMNDMHMRPPHPAGRMSASKNKSQSTINMSSVGRERKHSDKGNRPNEPINTQQQDNQRARPKEKNHQPKRMNRSSSMQNINPTVGGGLESQPDCANDIPPSANVKQKPSGKSSKKGRKRDERKVSNEEKIDKDDDVELTAEVKPKSCGKSKKGKKGKKREEKNVSIEVNAETSSQKKEVMPSLEDIYDIPLQTLKNRKNSYRRKIAQLKKTGENDEDIAKMETFLKLLSKTLITRRLAEKVDEKPDKKSENIEDSIEADNEDQTGGKQESGEEEDEEEMDVEDDDDDDDDDSDDDDDDSDDDDDDNEDDDASENEMSSSCEAEVHSSKYIEKLDKFDTFWNEDAASEKLFEDTAEGQNYARDRTTSTDSADGNKRKALVKQLPNEQAVFDFLVKHLNGRCSPEELKNNSNLFDDDFDIEDWLGKQNGVLRVIKREERIVSVIAFRRDATYCLNYIKRKPCQEDKCGRYHICKDYLSGYCRFSGNCNFSHDFLDEYNLEFSKKLKFVGRFDNDEITTIMRVRFPHLCQEWISSSACHSENCSALHVCKMFIIGRCAEGDDCPRGHSLDTLHNQSIIEALSMTAFNLYIFKNMVFVIREQESVTSAPGSRKKREFGTNVAVTAKGVDAEEAPNICENHLSGDCRHTNCYNYHNNDGMLPYIWQIKPDDQWLSLDQTQSESIERTYCDLDTKSATFDVPGDTIYKYCVWFEPYIRACISVDCEGEREQNVDARRISTESYGKDHVIKQNFKTQWRWYFSNDEGMWNLFTSENTDATQYTLETKFLAGQTDYYYSRQDFQFKYRLRFNYQQQENIDTGRKRDVIRRPLLVTHDMVTSKTYPPSLTVTKMGMALPNQWAPWDLVQPFELVKLDGQAEYTNVHDQFYTTLSKQKHQISSIYRVQNHIFWERYQMTVKQMKGKYGQELDMRQLFHGTGGINAVQGICINNIDPKVSGKNATLYGQGAYFARSAKYSHAYTDPDPVTLRRYMFLVDVIIGEYTQGQKEFRHPPSKPGSTHLRYDSCVDKMENPSIFVVFELAQFYPTYLIEYMYTDDEKQLLAALNHPPVRVPPVTIDPTPPVTYPAHPTPPHIEYPAHNVASIQEAEHGARASQSAEKSNQDKCCIQ